MHTSSVSNMKPHLTPNDLIPWTVAADWVTNKVNKAFWVRDTGVGLLSSHLIGRWTDVGGANKCNFSSWWSGMTHLRLGKQIKQMQSFAWWKSGQNCIPNTAKGIFHYPMPSVILLLEEEGNLVQEGQRSKAYQSIPVQLQLPVT